MLALVATTALASDRAGAAPSLSDSFALDLRIESRRFVVGEPIPAIVILWNNGSRTLPDVAPFYLQSEFLRLEVESADGRRVPGPRLRATMDTQFPSGGVTLPGRHVLCASFDVLGAIGTDSPQQGRLASLLGGRALVPGSYRVRANMTVHTSYSYSHGLEPLTLLSDWREFRVDSLTGEEASELESLWVDAGSPSPGPDGRATPGIRRQTRDHAATTICPRLRELAPTRFFYVAYKIALCKQADGPNLELIDALLRQPGRDVEAAWILDFEITTFKWPDAKKRAWTERALRTQRDPLQRAVLDSWLIKLDQRKGYTSFDP